MKTIGQADQFFTLWDVTKQMEYVNEYQAYEKVTYTYFQNLSKDEGAAIKKAREKFGIENPVIDYSLRGKKSWSKRSEGFVVDEVPIDLFAFGKFQFTKISECEETSYLSWYYQETKSEEAKAVLLTRGFKMYEGDLLSLESFKACKAKAKERKFIDSLKGGHHFENGEKVEIEIKRIGGFSFESNYGTCHVETYASKCGLLLKYMGSSPADISERKYQAVKATIKHNAYNGESETRLQRIKLN